MRADKAEAPLRICICTTFYPPWSADADGRYARDLANGLASRGHEVTVVHNPGAYEALDGRRVADGYPAHPDITIRHATAKLGRLGLLAIHQTGRPVGLQARLRAHLRGPFDVIHFHNVSLLGGPAVYALGQARTRIGSINDHWLVCPTHLLWKYTGEPCDRPQCFTCAIRQARPPQLWRRTDLLDRMTRHVDTFLGPSMVTIRAHLERSFARPMIHLPPPCSIPANLTATTTEATESRPYFLCAGRLEPHKGFQDVMPLFQRFPRYHLVVCADGGLGSEKFANRLRAMASGLPNVQILGPLPAAARHALYRGAIATIVPTRGYQTFCHVTAESFSAGTPVIARRHGVAEEIVAEHGGGTLYDRPGELEAAIEKLIADPGTRAKLAGQALKTYRNEYAVDIYVERYLRIVREILQLKCRPADQGHDVELRETFAGRRLMGAPLALEPSTGGSRLEASPQ